MAVSSTISRHPFSASFDFFNNLSNPPKTIKGKKSSPPISIFTKPSHVDPFLLQRLLSSAGLSPHRFPNLEVDERPEPADVAKLAIALHHSSAVVSAFCRRRFLDGFPSADLSFGFEDIIERMARAPDPDHQLVGFGRAVSDGGLTASIHDVVVLPSLQRLGIGRKIVQIIIRMLTSKGIYDISALCSQKERLFFQACGFGEDSLGSTTMMYTRTGLSFSQGDLLVRPAGRLLLLVPPARETHPFKAVAVQADDLSNAS